MKPKRLWKQRAGTTLVVLAMVVGLILNWGSSILGILVDLPEASESLRSHSQMWGNVGIITVGGIVIAVIWLVPLYLHRGSKSPPQIHLEQSKRTEALQTRGDHPNIEAELEEYRELLYRDVTDRNQARRWREDLISALRSWGHTVLNLSELEFSGGPD